MAQTCAFHTRAPSVAVCSSYVHEADRVLEGRFTFLVGQRVTILHAFIKKSQRTPDHELKIAQKRKKEVRND